MTTENDSTFVEEKVIDNFCLYRSLRLLVKKAKVFSVNRFIEGSFNKFSKMLSVPLTAIFHLRAVGHSASRRLSSCNEKIENYFPCNAASDVAVQSIRILLILLRSLYYVSRQVKVVLVCGIILKLLLKIWVISYSLQAVEGVGEVRISEDPVSNVLRDCLLLV